MERLHTRARPQSRTIRGAVPVVLRILRNKGIARQRLRPTGEWPLAASTTTTASTATVSPTAATSPTAASTTTAAPLGTRRDGRACNGRGACTPATTAGWLIGFLQ